MTTSPSRAALAAGATLLLLAGCAEGADEPSGDEIQVVVALSALEYVAGAVASENAEVINLTPDGADPHHLELAPADVAIIESADVVLYLSGLQPAVDEAVDMAGDAIVVDALEAAQMEVDPDTQVSAPPNPSEDPHLWLDPPRLAVVGQDLADALAQADPDSQGEYAESADELEAELRALDETFRTELAPCAGDTMITTHRAFGYLTARYGLSEVGIAGVDPEVEPSPARLREVEEIVEQTGAQTIFFEARANSRVAQRLAESLDVDTGVLDPMERTGGADYLQVMEENLESLTQGLNCAG